MIIDEDFNEIEDDPFKDNKYHIYTIITKINITLNPPFFFKYSSCFSLSLLYLFLENDISLSALLKYK